MHGIFVFILGLCQYLHETMMWSMLHSSKITNCDVYNREVKSIEQFYLELSYNILFKHIKNAIASDFERHTRVSST